MDSTSSSFFAKTLNCFALILFYTQSFSYIFKLPNQFEDPKAYFVANLIYFSNPANLLTIFKDPMLNIFVYITILGCETIFVIYVVIQAICIEKFKKNIILKLFSIVNPLFAWIYGYFHWALLLPSLEVLINLLFCNYKGSFFSSCSSVLGMPFIILSIYGILLTFFLGFCFLYITRSYSFLDRYSLRIRWDFLSFLIFLLRASLPLVFFLFNGSLEVVLYLLIALQIVLLCLQNYYMGRVLRNPLYSGFFQAGLWISIVSIILLFLWNFTSLVTDYSFFYLLLPLSVVSMKVAMVIYNKRYFKEISHFTIMLDFALEELWLLYGKLKVGDVSHFLSIGMLRNHSRTCHEEKCRMSSKRLTKFNQMEVHERIRSIRNLIMEGLFKEFKMTGGTNERLLVKYVAFLINCDLNPAKTYFEIQKVLHQAKSYGWLTEIMVRFLIQKLKSKMAEIEQMRRIGGVSQSHEQGLEISTFFAVSDRKERLQRNMLDLLNEKIKFFERYKQGLVSYDDMLGLFYRFLSKAFYFEAKITVSLRKSELKDNLILLKFGSIFQSVLLNNLQTANKFEDDIENIRKRYARVNQTMLSPLIFLNHSLITCEASFLNGNGRILDNCKTEKFAGLFGYQINDFKNVKMVNDLMPEKLAEHHSEMVFWSFERSRTEELLRKSQVFSFAKNRLGFIFPIKLFLGFSLRTYNDFILHAGVLNMDEHDKGVLFDDSGEILGVSQSFFKLFTEQYESITVKKLEYISIFSLIEGLRDAIQKNHGFPEKGDLLATNLPGSLILPSNLVEIVEFLEFKRTEESDQQSKRDASIASTIKSKSMKSNRSITSKRTEKSQLIGKINQFLSKTGEKSLNFEGKKETLVRLLEDDIGKEGVFTQLCDKSKRKRLRMFFELNFQTHRFGKGASNVFRLAYLKINHIQKDASNVLPTHSGITPTPITNHSRTELLELDSAKLESDILNASVAAPIKMPEENVAEFPVAFGRSFDGLSSKPPSNSNQPQSQYLEIPFPIGTKEEIVKVDPQTNKHDVLTHGIFVSKSFTSEGSQSVDLAKNINNFNYSTDRQPVEGEKVSGKASSVTSLKQSFGIFHDIKQIQGRLPRPIYFILGSLFLQVLFILAFCIFIYMITNLYIDSIYNPLKNATITQCRINVGMNFCMLAMAEFELASQNLTQLNGYYLQEMKNIINKSYNMSLTSYKLDMRVANPFGFGNYRDSWFCPYVNKAVVSNVLFVDLGATFYNIVNRFIQNGYKISDEDKIIPRNYPYYLMTALKLRGTMMGEFTTSNGFVTNNIVIMMSLLLVLVFLLKLIEYGLFSRYYLKITKLLNIFLRVNQKETLRELVFLKDILDIMKNPTRSYLYVNFPEQTLKKNQLTFENNEEMAGLSLKQSNKMKKLKIKAGEEKAKNKMSLFNIRPFSKTRTLIFLLITIVISVSFLVGLYFDWVVTNQSISKLLLISTIYNQIYFFTSATLIHDTLFMREQLMRNPTYESSGQFYQNHDNRLKYFYTTMNARLVDIVNFKGDLFNFALEAKSIINDDVYNEIMEGDTCNGLRDKGFFNDDQYNYCKTKLVQFKNGMIMIVNNYVNVLRGDTFINLKNQSSDIDLIRTFISTTSQQDKIIANYYLSVSLQYFYDYSSTYYSTVLNTQLGNLRLVIWAVSVICMALLLVIGGLSYRFLSEGYKIASCGLGLLPYEKLAHDEQTIFLIRRFLKEHSS